MACVIAQLMNQLEIMPRLRAAGMRFPGVRGYQQRGNRNHWPGRKETTGHSV